jgi:anti-sigma regulatory factor (Ser/Thr protein kinase)
MSDRSSHGPVLPQIRLKCHIDCSMLGLLREFVCCVARHLGFTEKQVAEIEISVDEACANAMEHAYPSLMNCNVPDPDCVANVQLEIAFDGSAMTVCIVDQGSGTGTVSASQFGSLDDYMDPARDKYRGLGLLLMQKFMDKVDIQSAPGKGTTVQMIKYRTQK